jgi:ERCC4-type nuclease
MKLVIDNRERDIIGKLKEMGVDHEIAVLELGDVNWLDDDGNIVLIIERKTVADLKASICDGRSREQKARLFNSGVSRDRIMFLIEGSLGKPLDSKISGIPVSTLVGSIVNMQLRDNVKVYKTGSLTESAIYISRLNQKLSTDIVNYFNTGSGACTEVSYAATLKTRKRENVTPTVWFVQQLCLVPQVTEKIASRIIEEYPTLISLTRAYEQATEENRPRLLKDLKYKIANDKLRRIGDKISERIYILLYGY